MVKVHPDVVQRAALGIFKAQPFTRNLRLHLTGSSLTLRPALVVPLSNTLSVFLRRAMLLQEINGVFPLGGHHVENLPVWLLPAPADLAFHRDLLLVASIGWQHLHRKSDKSSL